MRKLTSILLVWLHFFAVVFPLGIPSKGFAVLTEPDRAQLLFRNLLTNPGFENSKSGWTASAGTYSINTTAANVGSGTSSGKWITGAASRTLTSTAVAIPAGLYGAVGVAACRIQGSTAAHTIEAYDGSATISSSTVAIATAYQWAFANFTFPSSGNIQLRITSAASDTIYIDDCYVGDAKGFNLAQVSQATLVGSAYFATTGSCSWARTSTALGAFSTTAACPGPTVEFNAGPGVIQTTDSDLPKVTVNSLPPGTYIAHFLGASTIGTGSVNAAVAINDGTTTSGQMATNGATTDSAFHVSGTFVYTTTANRSFELYASSSSNAFNVNIPDNNRRLRFYLERFPSGSDLAYNPNTVASSWSGYHDSTCSFTRNNTTVGDFVADATCALVERTNRNFGTVASVAGKLPGIVFTPVKAGDYFVCAAPNISNNGGDNRIQLWDGTTEVFLQHGRYTTNYQAYTYCGIYKALSTASVSLTLRASNTSGVITIADNSGLGVPSIEWSIFQMTQGVPAPVLTGPGSIYNQTDVVALTLQGVSGQTADLLKLKNSSGTDLLRLNSSGFVVPAASPSVGMVVQGVASQAGDLLQFQNSAGTVLSKVTSSGYVSNLNMTAYFYESQVLSTVGGACNWTDNTFNTRTLNTTIANDTGTSLASNKMTIPGGTGQQWRFQCNIPSDAAVCNRYVGRLFDVTNSLSKASSGCVCQSPSATQGGGCAFDCIISVTASTDFRIEENVQTESATTTCLGTAAGASGLVTGFDHETFTNCAVTRVK